MSPANLLAIARPLAWLAPLAFLVGFVSYLAVGRPVAVASPHTSQALVASGPASDEWNLPKKI
jgi:hypothetical protein